MMIIIIMIIIIIDIWNAIIVRGGLAVATRCEQGKLIMEVKSGRINIIYYRRQ